MGRLSGLHARGAIDSGEPGQVCPQAPSRPAVSSPPTPEELGGVRAREDAAAPGRTALDAVGRITLLQEAFEGRTVPEPHVPEKHWRRQLSSIAGQTWNNHRRLTKTLIGLLVLVAAGWMPMRALLQTTSTEAVINARLVTLRAPIEGQIVPLNNTLSVGAELQTGTMLLRVVNRRADRSRVDDLRRLIDRLVAERDAFAFRVDELKALQTELTTQTRAFQDGRIRQLEARAAELASNIAAANANRVEAERALARAKSLNDTGTTTKAAHEKAARDSAVATETHAALKHRLAGIDVELAALRRGIFIGDSYNDQPRSSQRADEVSQKVSDLVAEIREREARLADLRIEVVNEAQRFSELAGAELVAPVRSSIWEILTAPGESVMRGQELIRLLDCSGMLVTATVGETAYNQIRMGDRARFRFRGESSDHEGRVVGLTGVAVAAANLAIQPAALAREPYRVTVALPDLTTPGGQCGVGRTGRVTFTK